MREKYCSFCTAFLTSRSLKSLAEPVDPARAHICARVNRRLGRYKDPQKEGTPYFRKVPDVSFAIPKMRSREIRRERALARSTSSAGFGTHPRLSFSWKLGYRDSGSSALARCVFQCSSEPWDRRPCLQPLLEPLPW